LDDQVGAFGAAARQRPGPQRFTDLGRSLSDITPIA
jgi:hypothetical protein